MRKAPIFKSWELILIKKKTQTTTIASNQASMASGWIWCLGQEFLLSGCGGDGGTGWSCPVEGGALQGGGSPLQQRRRTGGWARVGGGGAPPPQPCAPRPPAASIRASPHLPPAPARAPPPPAHGARRPSSARPPPALPGSLPVSLKCHRGAPGIAASKSRPTTQPRGHRSGAARAPPGAPRRPPGRLSRAREARPHPRGAAQGLPPGRPGRAGARAGGEDAAAAGRTARSARPAPPRALPAPAARAPEPGPAARALLRDRCRPSGRQGKRAVGRGGEVGGGPGSRPALASGTWGRPEFPLEAGQVATTRGCDAPRLALSCVPTVRAVDWSEGRLSPLYG